MSILDFLIFLCPSNTKYSLPDPETYMENPWTAQSWRNLCNQTISQYWEEKLRLEASDKPSLWRCDISALSFSKVHRIWEYAGLHSTEVTKATINMWFLLGVYHSNDLLFKMTKSPTITNECHCSDNSVEDSSHMILHCNSYNSIREPFFTKITFENPNLALFCTSPEIIILSIMDPESSLLPENIKLGWKSTQNIYELTRNFLFNIHRKREKLTNNVK